MDDITVSSDGRNNTITVSTTGAVVVGNAQDANIVSVGIQGPTGAQGAAGDKNFSQSFATASSVTVTHNLGKYPAVTVLDSSNDEVLGDVQNINFNQLTVTFSAPFSGIVICN